MRIVLVATLIVGVMSRTLIEVETRQQPDSDTKIVHEKDSNTRVQANLENEPKRTGGATRLKKKLESDINELEIALDHANKAKADALKNINQIPDQLKEIEAKIEEQRGLEAAGRMRN